MEFTNPALLFGFSALLIPILIHLFNLRRYKKEYFTNVRFLTQIQLETRKRSRLKQILVLAARLLALSSLVLAFSQPFIPSPVRGDKKKGYRAVSIYIDNSFSMEAIGKEGKLLDAAKKRASEIVSAYKSSDIFQLMTNDFEGKHSQFVSREEFLNMLREIRISPASVGMQDVLLRQKDIFSLQNESSHISFLISDFQKSTARFENLKPDPATHYALIPVGPLKQNNLYIDSVWFTAPVHRPGQAVKLMVRIKNCGNEKLEKIPLRLILNNIQKSVTSFSVDPSQNAIISLPYTEEKSGFQSGKLEVTDYPVIYDDEFYFSYNITNELNILSVYGKSANVYFRSLFSSDSVFNYRTFSSNQVDYGSFSKQNLILISGVDELASGLANELRSFMEHGGSVCIFPPETLVNETYNTFFSSLGVSTLGHSDTTRQRVASLDIENELFKDVFEKDASGNVRIPDNTDLPIVLKHYQVSISSVTPPEVLMRLQDGFPFLISTKVGKGKLYLCASPPDPSFTNFQQHLLFVPVLFRMSFLSESLSSLYYIIGNTGPLDLPADSVNEKNLIKIKKWNSSYEFIPELRTSGQLLQAIIHNQINEAGWYMVYRGTKQISALAFNYDRKESDISFYNPNELESIIKKYKLQNFVVLKPSGLPFTRQVEQLNVGFPLWKWFLVLALIFIAAEIIIIRLLRS